MSEKVEEMDIYELHRITSARIAEWPKWKQDYHKYKSSIRHAPDGSIYHVKPDHPEAK